eukprot:365595-Chlamydomonas_euryale.AAC.7
MQASASGHPGTNQGDCRAKWREQPGTNQGNRRGQLGCIQGLTSVIAWPGKEHRETNQGTCTRTHRSHCVGVTCR